MCIEDQSVGAIYNPNISVIKPTVRSSFWSSQCSKRFNYETPQKEEPIAKIPTPPSISSSSSNRYKRSPPSKVTGVINHSNNTFKIEDVNTVMTKLIPTLPVAKPKCSRSDMRAGVFQLRKILKPTSAINQLISSEIDSNSNAMEGNTVPALTLEVDNDTLNGVPNDTNGNILRLSSGSTTPCRLSYSPMEGDEGGISTAPTVPTSCVGFNDSMFELTPETES